MDTRQDKRDRAAIQIAGQCYQQAEADTLADLDTFTDWLAAQCMGMTAVTSEYETRAPGRLADASPATLLHAALVAGQRCDSATAMEAIRRLGDEYLRAKVEMTARRSDELILAAVEAA